MKKLSLRAGSLPPVRSVASHLLGNLLIKAMFTFVVVLAFVAVLGRTVSVEVDKVRHAAAKHFSDGLHEVAKSGFDSRKSASLRKVLAEYATGGFVNLVSTYDSKCNNPVFTFGIPANYCMLDTNFAYKILISAETDSCDGAVIEYFGDKECTESLGTSDLSDADFSCKMDPAEEGVISTNMVSYSKFTCSKYASPRMELFSAVTEHYFNNTDCAAGSMDSYMAFTEGICLENEDSSVNIRCSEEGGVMWEIYEPGTGCTGNVSPTIDFPTECAWETSVSASDDGYDDDGEGDDSRNPVNPPPSVSTTPFPTSAPVNVTNSYHWYCTVPSKVVTLKAQQTVDGFSLTTFNADTVLYTNTFKQAIAATMKGVSPSDIIYFAVTGNTASMRQAPAFLRSLLASLLTTDDSVLLSYTVSVATSVPADELLAQLTAAVEDGTFNTLLHEYATANGATALTTATSDSVDVTVVNKSDKKETITKGGIAGIVVGCFVGLCLIAMAVVLYMRLFGAPASAANAPVPVPTAVEMTKA